MGQVNPVRANTTMDEGVGETTEANALTTLLNEFNGNIDDANLKATYSGYAMYRTLRTDWGARVSATAQTYVFSGGMEGGASMAPAGTNFNGANGGWPAMFYYDPADYTAGSRTTRYRVRAALYTNATAPAITFTVGLYPVTAVAGGAGLLTITLGAVAAGSTVAFTTQAANTQGQGNSGDFTAPAAGHYILGVAASGSQAAGSAVVCSAQLQMRQT